MKRIILIVLITLPIYPSTQTITVQPNLMPLVVAYMQKHGKLPNSEELQQLQHQADNAVEQAKFANAVGTCATGLANALMTGNPLPAIASIFVAVTPLISRGPEPENGATNTPQKEAQQGPTSQSTPPC